MKRYRVHIKYYALLREESGQAEETLETAATNCKELFDQVQERHGFSLRAENMGVAVNDRFANWESPLNQDDKVVFLPPVAGG